MRQGIFHGLVGISLMHAHLAFHETQVSSRLGIGITIVLRRGRPKAALFVFVAARYGQRAWWAVDGCSYPYYLKLCPRFCGSLSLLLIPPSPFDRRSLRSLLRGNGMGKSANLSNHSYQHCIEKRAAEGRPLCLFIHNHFCDALP